ELTPEDLQIMDMVDEAETILVLNKTDLAVEKIDLAEVRERLPQAPQVYTSMLEKEGLSELEDLIKDLILGGEVKVGQGPIISSTRHKQALQRAIKSVQKVQEAYQQGLPYDFLTIDLKAALAALGEITGETLAEDIIDRIFNDFCIGK
ncbi:MAG: tRNA uridine-5-carboxymethylaminomethyl(34) synthesis GTPase MnmE, partial [Halanaerobium sp.]|nr:tRNA uridine-5-carboxymethylaminomethyl(34) synthesis GTPase MnmE [Halanaerobium sp.]